MTLRFLLIAAVVVLALRILRRVLQLLSPGRPGPEQAPQGRRSSPIDRAHIQDAEFRDVDG